MVLVLLSKRRDFTENFCLSDFVMFDNEFCFEMKCPAMYSGYTENKSTMIFLYSRYACPNNQSKYQ